jgi:hypothetical protein
LVHITCLHDHLHILDLTVGWNVGGYAAEGPRDLRFSRYDLETNEWNRHPIWTMEVGWKLSFVVVIDDILFAAGK